MPVRDLVLGLDPPAPRRGRARSLRGCEYRDFVIVGLLYRRLSPRVAGRGPVNLVPDNWIYVQEPGVQVSAGCRSSTTGVRTWCAIPPPSWIGMEYFCSEGRRRSGPAPMRTSRRSASRRCDQLRLADPGDRLDAVVCACRKPIPAISAPTSASSELRGYLDAFPNLFLVGRNGMHRYNNQDHSMLSAKKAVEAILAGSARQGADLGGEHRRRLPRGRGREGAGLSSTDRRTPLRLLAWCLAGAGVCQLVLWLVIERGRVSPIFWYLLKLHDTHGNLLLVAIAVLAYLLRGRAEPMAVVRLAAERPWLMAAIAFPLLCLLSVNVYRGYPLSMDEYATLFQAKIFAAGRVDGMLPPDLLDRLVPRPFHGQFFSVARSTGEISSVYWPAFSLYLAPFERLGVPWMANPLLGALALPAIHGLARELTGSREAGGWALLLTAASPVFVVTSISLYSMPAHLLCNLWFARLLLQPTPARAAVAGVLGSVALTLHFPLRHLLFASPFVVWLAIHPDRWKHLGALAAGYAPLGMLLGFGWHLHTMDPLRATVAVVGNGAGDVVTSPVLRAVSVLRLPAFDTFVVRAVTLSKDWTWGAAALLVLAAWGGMALRRNRGMLVLAAALLLTFAGYFGTAGDQGHGWGDRTLYQAWFVLPVFAAAALGAAPALRPMVAWCAMLSLVLANGLRVAQVDAFLSQHLRQLPPLASAPDPARPQIIFVNLGAGAYTRDMVHNDPFLRGSRIMFVLGTRESAQALMAQRFPQYVKTGEGDWGQLWEIPTR